MTPIPETAFSLEYHAVVEVRQRTDGGRLQPQHGLTYQEIKMAFVGTGD